MTGTVVVRSRLRRYPALGFLVAAALMASMLPSALRVPVSGPSASAELAPVPGRSDKGGDLSALGETSTRGLGSGAGSGDGEGIGGDGAAGDGLGAGGGPGGTGANIRTKRCVGRPLRQTEDPMSPSCVHHFEGDNFGNTWQGVTGEEIVVVEVASCNADGSFDIVDYSAPEQRSTGERALLNYFNERFQTYGRKVRVIRAGSNAGVGCQKAAIQAINEKLRPFFIYSLTSSGLNQELADEAARLRHMALAGRSTRQFAQSRAPYVVSYRPDIQDVAANLVESVCARLAGGVARYAGDPTMHDTRRKLALFYDDSNHDPDSIGAPLIMDGIRRRCGDRAGEVYPGYIYREGQPFDEQAIARMRTEGVTTVIGIGPTKFINTFTLVDAAKWYPEWWLADEYIGNNTQATIYPPAVMRGVFGMMEERRLGAPGEQYHRQAVAEGCDGCPRNYAGHQLYRAFMLLFTGIQAAGPRLTPHNFDRGMRALPVRQSRDPFVPSAYFAPGNHSFVKDFAVAWWDASGQPPGSSRVGCWRLVEDGLRYRAEDWAARPGDHGIHGTGQPCQGDRS